MVPSQAQERELPVRRFAGFLAVCVFTLSSIAPAANACSVCFGDPESPMSKGATAGVFVMVGFIGFVLFGIAGTAAFWMVRCRKVSFARTLGRTSP